MNRHKTIAVRIALSDLAGRRISEGAAKSRAGQRWQYDFPITNEHELKLKITASDRFQHKTVVHYDIRPSKTGRLTAFLFG